MNEKEEQAYNKAIEKLGINPAYQSLIIARLQMEIDDICDELASLFGCPCNFSPPDEIMLDSEYCEDGCSTMADVAERYADETGLLNSIPDVLRYYFDFEAYGRDMDHNGHFAETDSGYIEIFN